MLRTPHHRLPRRARRPRREGRQLRRPSRRRRSGRAGAPLQRRRHRRAGRPRRDRDARRSRRALATRSATSRASCSSRLRSAAASDPDDDAAAVVDAGADKVSINSAALADPSLITRLARRYGSQAVVVAIDAKRATAGLRGVQPQRHVAPSARRRRWAREAESPRRRRDPADVDRPRRHRAGFDCELTAAVARRSRFR